MDKIQQAIIYNARVNEKEHKDLETKIKIVSDSINEVKTELESKLDTSFEDLETKIKDISLTPGEKGDKGDRGDSIIGPIGPQGPKGDSIVGPKGDKGDDGRDGVDGLDGRDGKDGSPDTGEQIVKKINEQNDQIDYSKIKNLPPPRVEIREIRNGSIGTGLETIKSNDLTISNSTKSLNFVGPDVTKQSDNVKIDFTKYAIAGTVVGGEIPVGDIDGVNMEFTLAHTPLTGTHIFVFVDGLLYADPYHYSVSGNIITLTSPIYQTQNIYVKYTY